MLGSVGGTQRVRAARMRAHKAVIKKYTNESIHIEICVHIMSVNVSVDTRVTNNNTPSQNCSVYQVTFRSRAKCNFHLRVNWETVSIVYGSVDGVQVAGMLVNTTRVLPRGWSCASMHLVQPVYNLYIPYLKCTG